MGRSGLSGPPSGGTSTRLGGFGGFLPRFPHQLGQEAVSGGHFFPRPRGAFSLSFSLTMTIVHVYVLVLCPWGQIGFAGTNLVFRGGVRPFAPAQPAGRLPWKRQLPAVFAHRYHLLDRRRLWARKRDM